MWVEEVALCVENQLGKEEELYFQWFLHQNVGTSLVNTEYVYSKRLEETIWWSIGKGLFACLKVAFT